jgi:hypothetical protein
VLVALRESWSPRPPVRVAGLTRFPGPQISETRRLRHQLREYDRITVPSLLRAPSRRGSTLPLALEGALGGEDLLGEVLRRVGLGRGRRTRGGLRPHRRPALMAELVAGRVRGAAGGAGNVEARPTLAAEFHGGRVLMLAPGTRQAGALQATCGSRRNGGARVAGRVSSGQGHREFRAIIACSCVAPIVQVNLPLLRTRRCGWK